MLNPSNPEDLPARPIEVRTSQIAYPDYAAGADTCQFAAVMNLWHTEP